MTVLANVTKQELVAQPSQTEFNFTIQYLSGEATNTFKIFIDDVLVSPVDYDIEEEITTRNIKQNFTLRFIQPFVGGEIVRATRQSEISQLTSFVKGLFPNISVERAFDKAYLTMQEITGVEIESISSETSIVPPEATLTFRLKNGNTIELKVDLDIPFDESLPRIWTGSQTFKNNIVIDNKGYAVFLGNISKLLEYDDSTGSVKAIMGQVPLVWNNTLNKPFVEIVNSLDFKLLSNDINSLSIKDSANNPLLEIYNDKVVKVHGQLHILEKGVQIFPPTEPQDLTNKEYVDGLITAGAGVGYNDTGLIEGGKLSINDSTSIKISAGNGILSDYYTDPNSPVVTPLTWGEIDLTITNLTEPTVYVGVTYNGVLVQQTMDFSSSQRKSIIPLGLVSVDSGSIVSVASITNPLSYPFNSIRDLANSIGPLKIEGNEIGAGLPNKLSITKFEGKTYKYGANFSNSKLSPHIISNPKLDEPEITEFYKDGSGGVIFFPTSDEINPTIWDDGTGVLGTVPFGEFTAKRVYLAPQLNKVYVSLGTQTYTSINNALNGYLSEDVLIPDNTTELVLLGIIIVSQSATDLMDDSLAVFRQASKFSGIGGSGAGSGSSFPLDYHAVVGTEGNYPNINSVMSDMNGADLPLEGVRIFVKDSASLDITQLIDKNHVELVFSPSAVYTKGTVSTGINITGDNVILRGLKIKDFSEIGDVAIEVQGENTTIQNCYFENNHTGLNDLGLNTILNSNIEA